jgi:NADPH:quinone reductase-like Zn-dependent oxidoreductase
MDPVPVPPMPSLTKTWHSAPYAAIDPTQPKLSAKGKTFVITGGATAIGAAIARAFAAAGASRIAIMSRTEKNLLAAKAVVATSQAEPNQAQAKPNQAKPGQRFRLINQTGRALRPGLDSLPSISNTLWLS